MWCLNSGWAARPSPCQTIRGTTTVYTLQPAQQNWQYEFQSDVFEFTGTRKQKFQQALSILEMPRRLTMLDKLKAQLLALRLNYVAGYTEGYTLNGMTAWQIIQGSENAIINGLTGEYEYWKNLCDQFNNLGET